MLFSLSRHFHDQSSASPPTRFLFRVITYIAMSVGELWIQGIGTRAM